MVGSTNNKERTIRGEELTVGGITAIFSDFLGRIIIFKWPRIRHSPASFSAPSWENLHHRDSVICLNLAGRFHSWVRDGKGCGGRSLTMAREVFPHQGNCRMAHVSIIYPRSHKWKNLNKEDKEKEKLLVSHYISMFETDHSTQSQCSNILLTSWKTRM